MMNTIFSGKAPPFYRWTPQQDIAVAELAEALNVFIDPRVTVPQLSTAAQRHFTMIPPALVDG